MTLGIAIGAAAPLAAAAQVSGSAAIETDYRYRGYSLSGEDPVLALDVAYDDSTGLYAGATAIGALDDGDARYVGYRANVGYARRVGPGFSVDAGLQRTEYTSPGGRDRDFTEVYVGVARSALSARLSYSPDYYRPDAQTLYAEAQLSLRVATDWTMTAHVGGLRYLDNPPPYTEPTRLDWRLGLARQVGRVNLHAALSGRGSGGDYYAPNRGRHVLTGGISVAF